MVDLLRGRLKSGKFPYVVESAVLRGSLVANAVMAAEEEGLVDGTIALCEVVVKASSNVVKLIGVVGESEFVPFVSTVGSLASAIIAQASAVGENDKHVLEAGRRAASVQAMIDTLVDVQFPSSNPSFVNIIEVLGKISGETRIRGEGGGAG